MTDTEKTVFVYTLSLREVTKMVEMTDAEKTVLRDAIAGIRAAGVKLYAEGGRVMLEATPEQKQRIMLAAEGYSQARIARELRLNKRTVTRLLQRKV